MPDSRWLLSQLGFSSDDRVVVLHADDIGMCEASVSAFRQIVARGVSLSAAAMAPCGWFPAVAAASREPRADVGVHLTLNSEWDHYRWGPVLGAQVSELCDEAGYFFRRAPDVQRDSVRDAVHRELRAQILRAIRMGVDITHIDSHMFTLMHPALFGVYVALSREFRVPCCLAPPELAQVLLPQLGADERQPLVVFDGWAQLPLDEHTKRLERGRRLLAALPRGLCYLIAHPAVDTPELRAIAPDWAARVADYELYMDDGWARILDESGVKVVGMRAIRDAMFT